MVDPCTGQPVVEHQRLATASNDFLFLGPVPVFYWPMLATDLNDPSYYIRRAQLKQDNVFGTQVLTQLERLSNCWASATSRRAPISTSASTT